MRLLRSRFPVPDLSFGGAAAVPVRHIRRFRWYKQCSPVPPPAFRCDHDVTAGRHPVHLALRAAFSSVIARRQEDEFRIIDTTSPCLFGNHSTQSPCAHHGLVSASEYFRSPPRTRITEGWTIFLPRVAGILVGLIGGRFAQVRAAGADQHDTDRLSRVCAAGDEVCFWRSSTITGAVTELPCCQRRAWPLKVATPVACCNSASDEITCDGSRRRGRGCLGMPGAERA